MSKFRDLAHKQLDEWIEGKIKSNSWHNQSNDGVIYLGELKGTMVKAQEEYIKEHPPTRYVTVGGFRYKEEDVIKAIEKCGVKEPNE